jgi:hypothetical protein
MQQFFDHEGMQFETLIALGQCHHGLADAGEILSTVERIDGSDLPGWVSAWSDTAERLEAEGRAALAAGHRVSARAQLVRASNYWNKASFLADATDEDGAFARLWERHRQCWDATLDLWEPAVEHLTIPFGDVQIEGYLWPAPGAEGQPRPVVILTNGSDGPVTDMVAMGAAQANARGWHAITYDGPGQNSTLHRLKMTFRPDWEAVVTPVVDWVVDQPWADPDRLVLTGDSQAGYWVPRAAAFEHRLAAIVADPGVLDVSTSWTSHLPDYMLSMLDDPDQKGPFDEMMQGAMDESVERRWQLTVRMRPYGLSSLWEVYRAAREYRLDDDTLEQITCPVLITSPEGEQFWPGQSQQMADVLGDRATVVTFTEAEGASWHCEPAALALRGERIFDWLEGVLA